MKMCEKFNCMKYKWLYLAIIIVVLIGGGIAVKVSHEKFGCFNDSQRFLVDNQTYYELLYFENTDNLKLSTEQAKAILPLVESLAKTNKSDKTVASEIKKNIYSKLTTAQYYALISGSKDSCKARGIGKCPVGEGKNKEVGRSPNPREGNNKSGCDRMMGKNCPAEDSIKDFVIKMLKEKQSQQ